MSGCGSSRRRQQLLVHAVRVLLFVITIGLIHLQYTQLTAIEKAAGLATPDLSTLREFLPAADSFDDDSREVLDSTGDSIGRVLQTSPGSDHITGFSGPTNTLIVFDSDDRIAGIGIVSSGDTPEHVASVLRSQNFLNSFAGLTQTQAASLATVDAVSGATLTSMAIQESVIHRLSGQQRSLRFSDSLTVDEVRPLYSNVHTVRPPDDDSIYWQVRDESGQLIGRILRTSPASDNIVGYQGPTDTLIAFDPNGWITGVAPHHSYDNEPYVGWVREDEYFLSLFNGLEANNLADFDAEAAQVEGVSGATMTSMAIVRGIVSAAEQQRRFATEQTSQPASAFHWKLRDVGTGLVVLFGLVMSLTSLRLSKAARTIFRLVLVVYLGLLNGDLISQAMFVGWAQSGIPWRHAGGLVMLTAAAVCVPVTARRNVYCSHLCPHGAAQQLLRNRLPWRLKLRKPIARWLTTAPVLLLVWCISVAMTQIPISLASIEPFDAWIFRVAGWASITIAIAGLVASMFVPMAYCRFGCPTGTVLNYLRLNGRSHYWSRRDWFAVALVLLALGIWVSQ